MIWTTEGTLLNAVSACQSVQSMLQGKGPCSLCCLITSSCAAKGRAVVRTHAQVSVLSVCSTLGVSDMFTYRSTSLIKHFFWAHSDHTDGAYSAYQSHLPPVTTSSTMYKRGSLREMTNQRFSSKNTKVILLVSLFRQYNDFISGTF